MSYNNLVMDLASIPSYKTGSKDKVKVNHVKPEDEASKLKKYL